MTFTVKFNRKLNAKGHWVETLTHYVDRRRVSLEEFERLLKPPPDQKKAKALPTPKAKYPILCRASGVHKTQVAEAAACAAVHGVPTEFTPDGRPVLRDRGHRREFLKAHGMHDNNSYD